TAPLSRQAPRPARGGTGPPAPARRSQAAAAGLSRRAPAELPRSGALALIGQRRLPASPAVRRLPPVLLAVPALVLARLLPATGLGVGLRLAAATACLLIPGALVSRAVRLRGLAPVVAWSLAALLFAFAPTCPVDSVLQ